MEDADIEPVGELGEIIYATAEEDDLHADDDDDVADTTDVVGPSGVVMVDDAGLSTSFNNEVSLGVEEASQVSDLDEDDELSGQNDDEVVSPEDAVNDANSATSPVFRTRTEVQPPLAIDEDSGLPARITPVGDAVTEATSDLVQNDGKWFLFCWFYSFVHSIFL